MMQGFYQKEVITYETATFRMNDEIVDVISSVSHKFDGEKFG